MPSTISKVSFGLMFLCAWSARAELVRSPGTGASVVDVGPEAGLVYGYGNESILFHGSDEILVTSGRAGIYKTFNRGDSWVRGAPGLLTVSGLEPYVSSFCQSATVPEIVYAVTSSSDGVSRTDDFGDSWGPLVMTSNPMLLNCAVDPSDPAMVYALPFFPDPLNGLLFKSTDGGQSFSAVGAGLPSLQFPIEVTVAPTNPQVVYIANDDGIAGVSVSTDGGLNFRALPNAPLFPFAVYPHPIQDGILLVLTDDGLFYSADSGESFLQIGAGLPPHNNTVLDFDPIDPSILYLAASENGLFRSLDGGLTFDRLIGLGDAELLGFGVTTVAVKRERTEDPPIIYAGSSLGPYRSDDGGDTFFPIHNGYRGTAVNNLAVDAAGRLLVATISSAGVFRSTAPGVYQIIGDTIPREVSVQLQAVAAAPDDPNMYLAAGAERGLFGAIFWTTDGGGSWSRATVPGDPFQGRMRIAYAPSDSHRVYMVAGFGGLFRSDDGGQSFERPSLQGLASIAVDPFDPDVIYTGAYTDNRGIFKSTDGGRTLQQLSVSGNFAEIVIDPQRPRVIYAGSRTGAVIRSLDGGQTFAPAGQGLTGNRVLGLGLDRGQPMRLFAWMRAGGLFRSENGADSWTAIDTGETLHRSTALGGQTTLAINPRDPEHVYLGNSSVLQVEVPP